jgi:uncharacterized delta-60 repeat protein
MNRSEWSWLASGKILVAGHSDNGTVKDDFALARYLSNGSLDNGFGSGGKVTTAIGSGDDHGFRVLVQNDGKILVAGDSETSPADDGYCTVMDALGRSRVRRVGPPVRQSWRRVPGNIRPRQVEVETPD